MITIPVFCLLHATLAQLAGKTQSEMPPTFPIAHCTQKSGCVLEKVNVTLDANFRWKHAVKCYEGDGEKRCWSGGNCFDKGKWDDTLCPDPETCAKNCALEGVERRNYKGSYGISHISGGVHLNYVQWGSAGMSVGSRLYLADKDVESYKIFRLKNREFSFDVDVSGLICSINGAVYFVEMAADGGRSNHNQAGAKYGTGYCDAQCPHDIHFLDGKANLMDWNSETGTGRYGHCCTEMDIWEANKAATAFTPHPCETEGPEVCHGEDCGDNDKHERYKGVCDKDGCDFNAYRLDAHDFFGEGANFEVDSSKPITVVTQFITSDGTDDGDLSEIRRIYVQNGKTIKNANAKIFGDDYTNNSITDEFCHVQKKAFDEKNDYANKGGLKAMGEALDRGMVLVLSLWDDPLSEMDWLDATSGKGGKHHRGALRGPCTVGSGDPAKLREQHSYAAVDYTNFMFGELDSTYNVPANQKPDFDDPVEDESTGGDGTGPPSSGPCGLPLWAWLSAGAGALALGAGGFYVYHRRRTYEGREPLTSASA